MRFTREPVNHQCCRAHPNRDGAGGQPTQQFVEVPRTATEPRSPQIEGEPREQKNVDVTRVDLRCGAVGLQESEPMHLERATQFMHGERPLSIGSARGHKPAAQFGCLEVDQIDFAGKRKVDKSNGCLLQGHPLFEM